MSWDNARPRSRRYDSEHQRTRARHLAELRASGVGQCAEPVCIQPDRTITPGMDLHLCHDPTGTVVLGLGHAACNLTEAARRARARQDVTTLKW